MQVNECNRATRLQLAHRRQDGVCDVIVGVVQHLDGTLAQQPLDTLRKVGYVGWMDGSVVLKLQQDGRRS